MLTAQGRLREASRAARAVNPGTAAAAPVLTCSALTIRVDLARAPCSARATGAAAIDVALVRIEPSVGAPETEAIQAGNALAITIGAAAAARATASATWIATAAIDVGLASVQCPIIARVDTAKISDTGAALTVAAARAARAIRATRAIIAATVGVGLGAILRIVLA
jgi:hypothetical protein